MLEPLSHSHSYPIGNQSNKATENNSYLFHKGSHCTLTDYVSFDWKHLVNKQQRRPYFPTPPTDTV